MTAAHDYSDLHELIERLEPSQAEEVRAFALHLVKPGSRFSVLRSFDGHRRGRGSLRGQLIAEPDWDSDEVNEAIARDFR